MTRGVHAICPAVAAAARARRRASRWARLTLTVLPLAAGPMVAWGATAAGADAAAGRPQPSLLTRERAGAAAAQSAPGVSVAIDTLDPGPPVPQRFLGLSFEAAALGQLARYARRGDLAGLLRSLGPGILRFGGITADQNVAWTDGVTPRPAWASSVINATELRAIGVLARRSGWRILLTVGLAHYVPTAAAREVAAAHEALGPFLAAVEIGNEPDAYGRHGLRELPWIAQGYEEEVTAYREAIAALTPGIAIAGPDVSGPGVFAEWGAAEALAQSPALLTGHHYPLGCAQRPAPSIAALLSATTRGREARSLATYLSISRSNDVPLRMDESNSVSCGGVAGISDTFASALWASAYITQAMAAGVVGINLEGNPANCSGYTPVCAPDPAAVAEGRLRAQPVWYSLLLTRSLVGDHPLPTTITPEGSPEGPPNLLAQSFSAPDHTLKVLLADDEPPGSGPVAVRLQVGSTVGAASVLRLTAPSPSATSGVLLAGRAVAPDGSWRAPVRTPVLAAHSGIVAIELAPGSAALLSTSRAVARSRRHKRATRR